MKQSHVNVGSWMLPFLAVDLCEYFGCAHITSLHPQDLLLSHLTMMLLSLKGNLIVTVQVHSCCAKCCWPTHMWSCLLCGLCLAVEVAVLLQHVLCTRTWFLFNEFHLLTLISSRMMKKKYSVDTNSWSWNLGWYCCTSWGQPMEDCSCWKPYLSGCSVDHQWGTWG